MFRVEIRISHDPGDWSLLGANLSGSISELRRWFERSTGVPALYLWSYEAQRTITVYALIQTDTPPASVQVALTEALQNPPLGAVRGVDVFPLQETERLLESGLTHSHRPGDAVQNAGGLALRMPVTARTHNPRQR
jgi:hypothetical protein